MTGLPVSEVNSRLWIDSGLTPNTSDTGVIPESTPNGKGGQDVPEDEVDKTFAGTVLQSFPRQLDDTIDAPQGLDGL